MMEPTSTSELKVNSYQTIHTMSFRIITLWIGWWKPTFRRSVVCFFRSDMVISISALKMDKARFSETLAVTNQTTRRLNPKEHHQNFHRCENLNSIKLQSTTIRKTAIFIPSRRWKPKSYKIIFSADSQYQILSKFYR
jgi:hypothetical protein